MCNGTIWKQKKHVAGVQEEHRRGSMRGKQSRLLNLFAAEDVRTTPREENKKNSVLRKRNWHHFGSRHGAPERTRAAKFVVLPSASLLLLHQSRKEPGMKCIKAAFGDEKKKEIAREKKKEERRNKSRT